MTETPEVGKTLRNSFEFSGGEFYFTATFVGEDEVIAQRAADRIMASMQLSLRKCVEYFHHYAEGAPDAHTPCEHTVSSELANTLVEMRISVHMVARIGFERVQVVLARICLSIIRAGWECMAESLHSDDMNADELSAVPHPGIGLLLGLPGRIRGTRDTYQAVDEKNSGQYL